MCVDVEYRTGNEEAPHVAGAFQSAYIDSSSVLRAANLNQKFDLRHYENQLLQYNTATEQQEQSKFSEGTKVIPSSGFDETWKNILST
jgi:hypothetical protein